MLEVVERLCDRVAIIHRGSTLSTGPVAELLTRSASGYRILARPAARAAEVLETTFPGGIDPDGGDAILVAAPAAAIPAAVRALVAAGIDVLAVERRASTLEDVFLEVTGGETV